MDNAESLWKQILSDPCSVIRKGQSEGLFLDFIRKSKPDELEADIHDRKNYAKAISGFSNASGGVIVWGPSTLGSSANDVVTEVKPIHNAVAFETQLNGITAQAVVPMNAGVTNRVVPVGQTTGFVVTYVPPSDVPPHWALLQVDGYYIRCGSRFQPMEHYMIADAFGRRQRPRLEVDYSILNTNSTNTSYGFRFLIRVRNVGRYAAKHAAIRIKPEIGLKEFSRYGPDGWPRRFFTVVPQMPQNEKMLGYMLCVDGENVIHAGAEYDVAFFEDRLPRPSGEPDDSEVIAASYAAYAEDCEPVTGRIAVTSRELADLLPWQR